MRTRYRHIGLLSATFLSTAIVVACAPSQQVMEKPDTNMMKTESSPMAARDAIMDNGAGAMMKSKGNPQTKEEKIANAMSAAPVSIGQAAAILDWPAKDGDPMPELRKGTNGWTCLPDTPPTPGNDPICVDGKAMEWFQSYMTKKEPKLSQPGLGYMLQGGSDASNTDPFAIEPAPGEDWMNAPPHLMIFPSGDLDPKVYGTAMNGGPWIMWSGTPYEHLMVPME